MNSISGTRVGNMAYKLTLKMEDRYRRHLSTLKNMLRKKSNEEVVKELVDKELASYFGQ